MQRPVQPFGQGKLRLALGLCSLWFAILGCSLDSAAPSVWVLGPDSLATLEKSELDPTIARAELLQALESLFGTHGAPRWPGGNSDPEGLQALAAASETYRVECAHCHGLEGYGNGASSQFVAPKPWNFSFGVFPRSAPDGSQPSPAALAKILETGIPSSAMPTFARLGKPRLLAVAGHVLLLARRAQVERLLVQAYLEGGPGSLSPERVQGLFEAWESKQSTSPERNR